MNSLSGIEGILVLPDPQADPSGFSKLLIGFLITLSISPHLLRPELSIRGSDGVVLWAPVPEASVDEDCDPRPPEDEVGGTAQTLQRGCRDSVAQPKRMNGRPQCQFRPGIPTSICLHGGPDPSRGSPGFGHRTSLEPACRARFCRY